MSKRRRSPAGVDGPSRHAGVAPARRGAGARGARGSARGALLVGGVVVVIALAGAALLVGTGDRSPVAGLATATPSRSPSGTPPGAPTSPTASIASIGPAPTAITPIDGVACDPTEQVTYHVHAHLNIRVNGQLQVVPGDVGSRATCLFWLHTHQVHGVIHVEAPTERAFSLGQFFAIWGKPLDTTVVADWAVPDESRLWIFVNGEPYDGDPRAIPLENLASIELQIGPAALDPLPYSFPAELL